MAHLLGCDRQGWRSLPLQGLLRRSGFGYGGRERLRAGRRPFFCARNGRPAAVLMSATEFENWQETHAIQCNPALMQESKQGLVQLKKGHVFSFEDVFGEPLHPLKKKK